MDAFVRLPLGFEYWTGSDFEADAVEYLKSIKQDRPRVNLECRNGPAVREYASATNSKSIIDALDEHYFRRPVKQFERSNGQHGISMTPMNLQEELV